MSGDHLLFVLGEYDTSVLTLSTFAMLSYQNGRVVAVIGSNSPNDKNEDNEQTVV